MRTLHVIFADCRFMPENRAVRPEEIPACRTLCPRPYALQVGGRTRCLRGHIDSVLDVSGIHEVSLKMRNALKEYRFMSHGNVIEENQMLMNLSHVTHVRNYP